MNNKTEYCSASLPALPLFHQPFWLDAAIGSNWDVALVRENDSIVASMPFAFEKKNLGLFIRGPHLTQFLGPCYQIDLQGREKLNREMELLSQLVDQLPQFAFFEQRWHFSYQNFLPLHWKNFTQTTRYTYVIPDLKNIDSVFEGFNEKIKREIRKAEKEMIISSEKNSSTEFYGLLKKNFIKKKYMLPFDESLVDRLYHACLQHDSGKIFSARDATGKLISAIFIAWDSTTAYYIIGGKDPDSGNSGAMSLLFWKAMQVLSSEVASFDFEGSMLPGVENYFRSFGAVQKTFFEIKRIDSKLFFLADESRRMIQFFFHHS